MYAPIACDSAPCTSVRQSTGRARTPSPAAVEAVTDKLYSASADSDTKRPIGKDS